MEDLSGLDADNSWMFYSDKIEWFTIKNSWFTWRWYLYNFFYQSPGLPEIDMFCIEIYKQNNVVGKKYIWRVDFYSAFYYSKNILPKLFIDIYEKTKSLFIDGVISRTRVDIAFDFDLPIFNFLKYLNKSDNSKRDESYFNMDEVTGFPNSVNYLPKDSKWYGVRYYNKTLQSNKKWRSWLYWNENISNWFRIEYEMYNPYSSLSDDVLFDKLKAKIFNWETPKFSWLINYRPTAKYDINNSYEYLTKYSENHWVKPELVVMNYIFSFMTDSKISDERKQEFNQIFWNLYEKLAVMAQTIIYNEGLSYEYYLIQIKNIYPDIDKDSNAMDLFKSMYYNSRKKIS